MNVPEARRGDPAFLETARHSSVFFVNVINESIQRKRPGATVMKSRGGASPRLASREVQNKEDETLNVKYNES